MYIIVIVFFCALFGVAPTDAVALFTDTPSVLEISEVLADGNCPWFLLFYVGWCPHCRAFANVYSTFAKNISNDTVVASLDCVAHPLQCGKVSGYPSLYYYDGNAKQNGKGMVKIDATTVGMMAVVSAATDSALCQHERTRLFDVVVATAASPETSWPSPLSVAVLLTVTVLALATIVRKWMGQRRANHTHV